MPEDSLRDEATALLRELVRLDTVNPPGNETPAAELIRDYLAESGVESELLARDPARANLVARLPGTGHGRRLLLVGHTDTVLADPAEWTAGPWGGEIREGCVWGRGTLDMKGQVAAGAVALASLAREGFRPAGDLVFAATADEEVGDADVGLAWLCREHPDAVRAEYCVNEGGGDRIVARDRALYLCAVAEKTSSPFRLRVHGRSGHASMPGVADNALVKAAAFVERLAAGRPRHRLLPESEAFCAAVFGRVPDPDELAEHAGDLEPALAAVIEPMLGLTVAPTIASASRKRNVVPARCEIECDCRLLPGQTQDEAEAELRAWLGEGDYELEWVERVGGSRSSTATPLWEAIDGWVRGEEPGAAAVPVVLPGFTDSHFLREAFGTIAYGFFPFRAMAPELASRLVHSADERIAIDDLELGTRFLRYVARTIGEG